MSTSAPRGFHYALYSYHPHRVHHSTEEPKDNESESVAAFFRKEATVDGDFSLTCCRHNLDSLGLETQVRDFISRRLSRGAVYTGSGNVSSIEIQDLSAPLGCYFSLLRVNPMAQAVGGSAGAASPDYGRRFREYVVCYLCDREGVDLLPFRTELDNHAQELQTLLHQENPADSSQVTSDVVSHLQSWQKTCLFFVTRCVDHINIKLPFLLYSSLCCIPMDISSTDKTCSTDDLNRFVNACGLTALVQAQPQITTSAEATSAAPVSLMDFDPLNETAPATATDGPAQGTRQQQAKVTVGVSPDACTVSSSTSNRFCEEWAVALRSIPDKDNPSVMRQIIENFKLKANQHMNTLKRLLRNAETDHYMLYRAFVFLETCGMGQVLLAAAIKEAEDTSSVDCLEVCKALEEFMQSLPPPAQLEKMNSTTSTT